MADLPPRTFASSCSEDADGSLLPSAAMRRRSDAISDIERSWADDVRRLTKAIPAPAMENAGETFKRASARRNWSGCWRSRQKSPNPERVHAIVRCLADLGMRSIEVTRLTLDDIDW